MNRSNRKGDSSLFQVPKLACTAGSLSGQRFPLDKDVITLGRTAGNDIHLDNPHISRHHAKVVKEERRYRIYDLDSRNGILVNDRETRQCRLGHGDEIRIEDYVFVFETTAEEAEDERRDRKTLILSDDERKSRVSIEASISPGDSQVSAVGDGSLPPGFFERLQKNIEMLHGMGELMSADIDQTELTRKVAQMLVGSFGAERAVVLLLDRETGEPAPVAVSVTEGSSSGALSLSKTVIDKALKEKSSLLCRDAVSDPRFDDAKSVLGLKLRSVMCAPLKTRDRLLGLLYLDNRSQADEFSEEDLRLLKTVAGQAAIVIENFGLVSALRREVEVLHEQVEIGERSVLGESRAISAVIKTARKAAASNATILILGQSGTGKEVLARSIHHWSGRRDRPFVVVNCAALGDELLQSELFGHERGAFTGAVKQKKGKLELADSGTVFLDEIGEMKPETQVKLLRVLQEREFERVGGTRSIKVDVRILAATNRDLLQEVKSGQFREDLYFRLRVIELVMPPLNERKEDIPLLARHFLEEFMKETNRPLEGLTDQALALLTDYPWPGNVRELKNTIERAVVLCSGKFIEADDLNLEPAKNRVGIDPTVSGFHGQVKELKKQVIQTALDENNGVKTDAAEQLGLQLSYLSRLMKNLGMR